MSNKEEKYSSSENMTMMKLFDLVENVNENVISANNEITALKVNIGQNNVVLEQHHARSTNLEGIVEKIKEALTELTAKIISINTNVNSIDVDLEPIKKHVSKVDRYITLANGIPLIFKFAIGVFVFVSSGYGCYNIIVKLLN